MRHKVGEPGARVQKTKQKARAVIGKQKEKGKTRIVRLGLYCYLLTQCKKQTVEKVLLVAFERVVFVIAESRTKITQLANDDGKL